MQDKLLCEKENKNEFAFYAILLVVLIFLFTLFNDNFMIVKVDGDSMNYTLSNEDVLLVSKNAEIKRGDVVVFDMPYAKLIKRVIAVEGDEVYSNEGKVYLKKAGEEEFSLLLEDYAKDETFNLNRTIVQEGCVLVLGDNRSNSQDSRYFGCISLQDVNGVVTQSAITNKSVSTAILGWAFNVSEFFGGLLWRNYIQHHIIQKLKNTGKTY